MANNKLFPPELEGTLPAFYKTYDDQDTEQLNAISVSITIPFGMNQGVNATAISTIVLKLRTTSTNTYIISDEKAKVCNLDEGYATFIINNSEILQKLHESQYYRAQIAFVDKNNEEIGYYSTVGIIKCIAKPTVYIDKFESEKINSLPPRGIITGVYEQNINFGDSTEKVYSYNFILYDDLGNIVTTSNEQVHDSTQDTSSYNSEDRFVIYKDLEVGKLYKLQYIVTTLNGLVISSDKYRVMKMASIDPEYNIFLYGEMNYDEGYIGLSLEGAITDLKLSNEIYEKVSNFDINKEYYYKNENNDFIKIDNPLEYENYLNNDNLYSYMDHMIMHGEESCSGSFLITRASDKDNYFEWEDVLDFALNGLPSDYPIIKDFTIEQGVRYKYAIQQYNINNIYSNKIYMTDKNTGEKNISILADFEDMFLYDGERQLKIRFNPNVTKFMNSIPEQKVEAIGNKYPFIFRNGIVSYKNFSISGLISYQMDNANLFLNTNEAEQAHILENQSMRIASNYDSNLEKEGHETTYKFKTIKTPIYDIYTGLKTGEYKYTQIKTLLNKQDQIIYEINTVAKTNYKTNFDFPDKQVKTTTNLTEDNIMSERYFKLKVLEWLSDGNVKLFRSPTEGNYLVRLLKVQLKPEKKLGRMIHNFSCNALEIDNINYNNLVYYKIIRPSSPSLYETHWGMCNTTSMFNTSPDQEGYYQLSLDNTAITSIDISNFCPGDQLKIEYNDPLDQYGYYIIGTTGSLNLNNDGRLITNIYLKPNTTLNYNDFSRTLIYTYIGTRTSWFDTISDVDINTCLSEQFIGPKTNLFATYNLRENAYGKKDQYGLTPNKISKEVALENIYQSLLDRNYINYSINDTAEKFKGLKVDILHVQKRQLIPIFAYNINNIGEIDENTRFAFTPFNKGYVNNQNILNYINNNEINYNEDKYLTIEPYSIAGGVNINDLYTILDEHGPKIDYCSILKTFIYNSEIDEWLPVVTGQYQYYDTYINSWWDETELYDVSFSINENENFEIQGDNNIQLIEQNEMTLYNLGEVKSLRLGNGVMAEVTIELRIIEYNIENTNTDLIKAKNDYLTTKADFKDKLEKVLLKSIEIQEADQRKTELLNKCIEIKKQIELYENSKSAIGNVKQITEEQMIVQKQNLYTNIKEKINTLLDIFKTITVPISIDDNGEGTNTTLINSVEYVDEINNNFEDILINEAPLQLYNYNNEFINPDIINAFYYIYPIEQEEIINKYTIENQNIENQIQELQINLGKISGNYDEEENLNTITYYNNQIELLSDTLNELTKKYNEDLTSLITDFLSIVINQDNSQRQLLNDGDTYIRNNAYILKSLLQTLINKKQEQLNKLQEKYNSNLDLWYNYTYYNDSDPELFGVNDAITPWDDRYIPIIYKNNENKIIFNENGKLINESNIPSPWMDVIEFMTSDSIKELIALASQIIIKYHILISYCDSEDLPQNNNLFHIPLLKTWQNYGWDITKNQINKKDTAHKHWELTVNNSEYNMIKTNCIIYFNDFQIQSVCALDSNHKVLSQYNLNTANTYYIIPDDSVKYLIINVNSSDIEKYDSDLIVNYYIILMQKIQLMLDNPSYSDEEFKINIKPEEFLTEQELEEETIKTQKNILFKLFCAYLIVQQYSIYLINVTEVLDEKINNLQNIKNQIISIDKRSKLVNFSPNNYIQVDAKTYIINDISNYDSIISKYSTSRVKTYQNLVTYCKNYKTTLNEFYNEVDKIQQELASGENAKQMIHEIQLAIINSLKGYFQDIKDIISSQTIAYNNIVTSIEDEISEYQNDLSLVEDIILNPGVYNRNYLKSTYDANSKDNISMYNNIIAEYKEPFNQIKQEYIEKIEQDVLDILQDDSLKNYIKQSDIEILLPLLTDKYNINQSKDTANLISKYTQEKVINLDIDKIKNQIEQTKASYILNKINYETEIQNYENNIIELQEIINNMITKIDALTFQKNKNIENIEAAQKKLNEYNTSNNLDKNEIIDKILSSKIYDNISIIKEYLDYIITYENTLQSQISALYSNDNNIENYIESISNLMKAYEKEAFSLLHYYDSIEDDLNDIDQTYNNFDFNIKKYNNILYLGEKNINKDNIDIINIKNELEQLLLDNEDIKFSIFIYNNMPYVVEVPFREDINDFYYPFPTPFYNNWNEYNFYNNYENIINNNDIMQLKITDNNNLISISNLEFYNFLDTDKIYQEENNLFELNNGTLLLNSEENDLSSDIFIKLSSIRMINNIKIEKYFVESNKNHLLENYQNFYQIPMDNIHLYQDETNINLKSITFSNFQIKDKICIYYNDDGKIDLYTINNSNDFTIKVNSQNISIYVLPYNLRQILYKKIDNTYETIFVDFEQALTDFTATFQNTIILPTGEQYRSGIPFEKKNFDWIRELDGDREIRLCPEGIEYNPNITYFIKNPLDNTLKEYQYINDELWNEALQNKEIRWITDTKPLVFTIKQLSPLYKKVKIMDKVLNSSAVYQNNELQREFSFNNSLITLIGKENYWEKLLGTIIYESSEKDIEDQGTLTSLYNLNIEYNSVLLDYIQELVKYNMQILNNNQYNNYLKEQQIIDQYLISINYWANVLQECQLVMANWDINEEKDNTIEKQQLELLIVTAQNKIYNLQTSYLKEQKRIENTYSEIILNYNNLINNCNFYEEKYLEIINKFNNNFNIYQRKINHYLLLLFNDNIYNNISIDVEITNTLDSDYLNIYNTGLFYTIDIYKKIKLLETNPQNFANILAIIQLFNNILNNNFKLYDLLTQNSINENKQYFTKDTENNFINYIYTSNSQWEKDLENGKIFNSIYPALLDLVQDNYELSTEYNENEQYYLLKEAPNFYTPITIQSNLEWKNLQPLYINKSNGGLLKFINDITPGSEYLNNFITIYKNTLILYNALIEQELGNDNYKESLENLYMYYQNEINELEALAKYINDFNIDETFYQNKIRLALAEYLRVLTITYVDQIERRLGVV